MSVFNPDLVVCNPERLEYGRAYFVGESFSGLALDVAKGQDCDKVIFDGKDKAGNPTDDDGDAWTLWYPVMEKHKDADNDSESPDDVMMDVMGNRVIWSEPYCLRTFGEALDRKPKAWVRHRSIEDEYLAVSHFNKDGVEISGWELMPYDMFHEQFVWDDGKPCGVVICEETLEDFSPDKEYNVGEDSMYDGKFPVRCVDDWGCANCAFSESGDDCRMPNGYKGCYGERRADGKDVAFRKLEGKDFGSVKSSEKDIKA